MYIKVGEAWVENVWTYTDGVATVMLTTQEEKAGQVDSEDLPALRAMVGHALEFYEKKVEMVKCSHKNDSKN